MEKFSASRAARLEVCPGSANLELAIPGWNPPDETSHSGRAAEGDTIHAILSAIMQLRKADIWGIIECLEYVSDLMEGRRFNVLTEAEVEADWLPSKPTTTVDLVLYLQDELHIIDWKTGMVKVEADENVQLLFYAMCFLSLAPKAKGVYIHIVQPWAENMKQVWIPAEELTKFAERMIAADQRILDKDLTLVPSDYCTFCPANPHGRGKRGAPNCPAMMDLLYPKYVDEDDILGDE